MIINAIDFMDIIKRPIPNSFGFYDSDGNETCTCVNITGVEYAILNCICTPPHKRIKFGPEFTTSPLTTGYYGLSYYMQTEVLAQYSQSDPYLHRLYTGPGGCIQYHLKKISGIGSLSTAVAESKYYQLDRHALDIEIHQYNENMRSSQEMSVYDWHDCESVDWP